MANAQTDAFLRPEPEPAAPKGDADPEAYGGDQDALHVKLVRWFEESERESIESRRESELHRDYKNCIQWTAAEKIALKDRHQPETTFNYVSRKVDLLCGMERKARTDAKAFPRDPTEDDRADAATQALRFVSDDNDFSVIRSAVYENILVEGCGGVLLGLDDDGQGGADITYEQAPWERIWADPHSRALDYLDARYKGLAVWMDRDQADETYPNAAEVLENSFSEHNGNSYDDRPGNVAWTDTTRKRTRVLMAFWSEGKTWWECTFTRAGILVPPYKSKFKDRRGKSACRLLLQAAYRDRENHAFGAVRDWISPQDEINKRHSKALHLLSVRTVIAEQGAVTDIDKARREAAKPDGYVEITPGMKFEIEKGGDLAAGQFQLLQHATAEMQAAGPNASMSGTDPRELSGRAILAQQAGGMAQNEPLADGLRMWSRRVYEMSWMAAREFWTAGKWVRVTDDLGATKWVGINRQVTLQDELAAMPEQQRAGVMQRMQPPLQPGDPRLSQVVRIENDITDLDVDITIDEGIDVPTMQAEQFQTLVQLAGMQPNLIPGDVLIAASGLKNKDQLLERMKAHAEQQQQAQAQQQPLIQRHAEASVAKLEGDAAAQMALAKERGVNAAKSIHDIHGDFSAPPYGQPFAAPPDPPSAPGTAGAPPEMSPEMMLEHHIADLRVKHANAATAEAKAALIGRQVAHEPHKAVATIAGTHSMMVNTNRLAQTPIPQPATQGAT
jgi:hypothetical protein